MAECGPLTITGWQTLVVVVLIVVITFVYGELCARDAARRIRDEFYVEDNDSGDEEYGWSANEADTGPIEFDERPQRRARHSQE
ncbi:hypothetical protein HFP15_38835 [Amycolatopsis sp. K13G38]|uniref:Uncharacterized protein n=1 Tax=Amycolatopsis acididurans TaxID=2724524 RepID=A0ABX1JJK2_9PSEU|nr:hypothetical protein [Amycolatopsis acididurans]NKQ58816.1 hypothetical protein [Amycolatopsis acididurans]